MKSLYLWVILGLLGGASTAFAGTIDFENAPPAYWETGSSLGPTNGGGQDLAGYYQGVVFGAGDQVTTTSSGYPAHSGQLELIDTTVPAITMTFTTPQSDVSFYYTTAFGFDALAYDASGNQVAEVAGNPNTTGITGSDTLLDFGVGNISYVEIDENYGLNSYTTIDDLTAPGVTGLAVPEPGIAVIFLCGAIPLGFIAIRRKIATR